MRRARIRTWIDTTLGVLLGLATASCQHSKLRVDGDRVKGPGYVLSIPAGFTAQTPSTEILAQRRGRAVVLVAPAADGAGVAPMIVHTDDEPLDPPTAEACVRMATAERDTHAKASEAAVNGSEPIVHPNVDLGPVCAYSLHHEADGHYEAFRLFKILLDGSKVACSADTQAQADAICDGYLASWEKPSRWD